jgi:hypothetical protein
MKTLITWLSVVIFAAITVESMAQNSAAVSQTPAARTTQAWDVDAQTWDPIAQTLKPVALTSPQLASQACITCRKQCADTRDRCKNNVCTGNGGQNNTAQACNGVKNQKGYIDGLKVCEDQEKACWNQCAAGACK